MATERSVEERLGSWERTVGWAEDHPVDFLHEEFENAVNTRNWIAQHEADGDLSAEEAERVEHLDERFRRATVKVTRPFRAPLEGERQEWWWFRVPRELQPAFVRSLEYEAPGLIAELGSAVRVNEPEPPT